MEPNFNKGDKFFSWGRIFKRDKNNSVGIDVGSNSMKIVELEKKDGNLVLKNYALAKFDRDLIRLGTSKHLINNIAGELAKSIFEKLKIKNKKINLAIPGFASLVTVINLEVASVKEAQKILELEVPKFIPIPIDEVVYDWQIIEERSIEKENKEKNLADGTVGENSGQKAILVAIMKEISQQYEKIFEVNGFEIGFLEVDSFSLIRSLVGEDDLDNYIILDIGGKVCNIIFTHQGNLIVNKNVNVAGYKMTEAMSRAMGIDRERAERMKIQQGLNVEVEQLRAQVFEPLLGMIIEELKKSLNIFKKNYPDKEIKGIILSGGTSKMSGLVEYLKSKTGMDIFIGNPWSRIDCPDNLEDKLIELGPSFAVAVGLAMLGLEN